jgi:hypothetical protein
LYLTTAITTNNNSNNNLEKEILVVIKAEFCMFVQLSKPGIAFMAILFMKRHSIMAKFEKTNREFDFVPMSPPTGSRRP